MINSTAVIERHCTVLMHYDKSTPPNEDEIREELESKEMDKKVSGLKTLISLLLNGEVMPTLLMTVIRFCVPCDDHKVKKLLLVYWEVIEKVGPDGKLVPEMILVTDRLRNDLVHANEYVRGCTLRFLCKLKEVSYPAAVWQIPSVLRAGSIASGWWLSPRVKLSIHQRLKGTAAEGHKWILKGHQIHIFPSDAHRLRLLTPRLVACFSGRNRRTACAYD